MRVILAEDSMLFREGLVRLLKELDFEVVAETDNSEDLLRRVGGTRPDLAIIDIRMPPTFTDEGLLAAEQIGVRYPEVGVMVLSSYLESEYAIRLLGGATGGRGYLLKDHVSDLDSFAAALRRVGSGGSVVDPDVGGRLIERQTSAGPLQELSEREREILGLMAEGRSNLGMCERLTVSTRTIESHIRSIFRKLDLDAAEDDNRRVLAVLAYLRAA